MAGHHASLAWAHQRRKKKLPPFSSVVTTEAWTRCASKLASPDILTRWPTDAATTNSRRNLVAASEAVLLASMLVASTAKTIPFGSVLHNIDLNAELKRRVNKQAPALYQTRCKFYRKVQAERLRKSSCSPNGFYAVLLQHTDENHDELTGYLARVREGKFRAMMRQTQVNLLASIIRAWRGSITRDQRAKALLAQHLLGLSQQALFGWKNFVRVRRRLRQVVGKVVRRLKRDFFATWRDLTIRRQLLRNSLLDWKAAKETAKRQRGKVTHFMLECSERRIFISWRKFVKNETKARHFASRRTGALIAFCFRAWVDHMRIARHVTRAVVCSQCPAATLMSCRTRCQALHIRAGTSSLCFSFAKLSRVGEVCCRFGEVSLLWRSNCQRTKEAAFAQMAPTSTCRSS